MSKPHLGPVPIPLTEQIVEAVRLVKGMFNEAVVSSDSPPEGATLESLWEDLKKARQEVHDLRKVKRGVKPKVEAAVRIILEDERLTEIPVGMIADIIQRVFTNYGITCQTTEKSIRWYMSQRNMEWDIKKRVLPRLTVGSLHDEPSQPS